MLFYCAGGTVASLKVLGVAAGPQQSTAIQPYFSTDWQWQGCWLKGACERTPLLQEEAYRFCLLGLSFPAAPSMAVASQQKL